jgi:hypothetical protein
MELADVCVLKTNSIEVPLADWTFVLYFDENENGIAEVSEFISEKTTGLDGKACWYDLMPGMYILVEEQKEGWMVISPVDGIDVFELAPGDELTRTFINSSYHDETAWGFYGPIVDPADQLNNDFLTFLNTSNWGWSIGPLPEGDYELTLLAACGTTKVDKKTSRSYQENGIPVGTVEISYHNGEATVTYTIDDPNYLMDIHLWVGYDKLPKDKKGNFTNAPGQFPYYPKDGNFIEDNSWSYTVTGLSGNIYVAAHAVVRIPDME